MTSPSRMRRIRISRSTRDIQIAGTHRPGCPLGEVGGPAVDVRPRGPIYTALEIRPISHTGSMLVWLLFTLTPYIFLSSVCYCCSDCHDDLLGAVATPSSLSSFRRTLVTPL